MRLKCIFNVRSLRIVFLQVHRTYLVRSDKVYLWRKNSPSDFSLRLGYETMNCMMLVNVDAAALGSSRGLRVAALANAEVHALEGLGVLILGRHGALLRRGVQLRALATYTNHCESPETWWT